MKYLFNVYYGTTSTCMHIMLSLMYLSYGFCGVVSSLCDKNLWNCVH